MNVNSKNIINKENQDISPESKIFKGVVEINKIL